MITKASGSYSAVPLGRLLSYLDSETWTSGVTQPPLSQVITADLAESESHLKP